MPERLAYPSIPVPKEDLKSLNETALTLKRAVEMLTGQDQGDVYASHVFVQFEAPVALHVGDLWVCMASPGSLNVWMNEVWVKLADVTPVTTAPLEGDLNLQLFTRRQHR